jgi:hypothetical protein
MVGYSEIGDEVDRKRGTTGLRAAFELPTVRSARGEEVIDRRRHHLPRDRIGSKLKARSNGALATILWFRDAIRHRASSAERCWRSAELRVRSVNGPQGSGQSQ